MASACVLEMCIDFVKSKTMEAKNTSRSFFFIGAEEKMMKVFGFKRIVYGNGQLYFTKTL
ncbi:hypothetical protein DC20_09260 [Rufibacter tibetensis]|uniref:Uncharacterized protein n=1 Tax=Rufibacter tibetensis TaxID=512763 RepID=A0A0P0CRN7_9BACT|nr:hypothetical protein DC20_09260 [Rufibacter tibetensis]